MQPAALDNPGINPRAGYDAWRADGSFLLRSLTLTPVFRRRAKYFRLNADGRVFRVESASKTVQVQPVWRGADLSRVTP